MISVGEALRVATPEQVKDHAVSQHYVLLSVKHSITAAYRFCFRYRELSLL